MRVVLAKHGIPWDLSASWSPGRRLAAFIVVAEDNGGRMNWNTGNIDWPKPPIP